jgi:serine/threonine-protein kinase PknG
VDKGSLELLYRIADASISQRIFTPAYQRISEAEQREPYDWRLSWYRGKALIAQGKVDEALTHFDVVYGEVPGETAPKLALGLCYEIKGLPQDAIAYYESVARTDAHMTAAAFGLARSFMAVRNRAAAVKALQAVPSSSVRYGQALLALAQVLTAPLPGEVAPAANFIQSGEVMRAAQGLVEGIPYHEASSQIYVWAVEAMDRGTTFDLNVPIFNAATAKGPRELKRNLRTAAEHDLLVCARYARDRPTRVEYVDQANKVAPRRIW